MIRTVLRAVLAASILAPVAASAQPTLGPVLAAGSWLGDHPSSVSGDVVIVDVFTVDCYNCQNVVPALRDLYGTERAHGLRIIGVHAPEMPAEKQRRYVVAKLKEQGITWPVAVDNDFSVWNAYGVTAWPTQLIFDRHGRLRKTIVGDSQDDLVRQTVRALLDER